MSIRVHRMQLKLNSTKRALVSTAHPVTLIQPTIYAITSNIDTQINANKNKNTDLMGSCQLNSTNY